MPNYAEAFSAGLIDPSSAPPADLVAGAGKGVQKRYNVYRNNVTVSLIDALAAIYPVIQRITGVTFFRAMARFHIRATPPTSPLLFDYGRDFPTFIAGYEYAQHIPWLADVARIERAWLDAYHAADLAMLSLEDLTAVPTERLAELRLRAHPASSIVRSSFPAVSIFTINKVDGPVTALSSSERQDALITRRDHEVMVSHLAPGAATFLSQLLDGHPLGIAAESAFEQASDFDLPTNLASMVAAGVFASTEMDI